jgi:hypothetical protein
MSVIREKPDLLTCPVVSENAGWEVGFQTREQNAQRRKHQVFPPPRRSGSKGRASPPYFGL